MTKVAQNISGIQTVDYPAGVVIKPQYGSPCEYTAATLLQRVPILSYWSSNPSGIVSGRLARYAFRPPTSWSVRYARFVPPDAHSLSLSNGSPFACLGVYNPGILTNAVFQHLQYQMTRTEWNEFLSYSSTLLGETRNAVLTKIKDSQADLGLMLLERKETEHLLIGALSKISTSVSDFRLAHRRGFSAVKKAYLKRNQIYGKRVLTSREAALIPLPAAWLELQYGWKPLMSDVRNAMHAVDYFQQNNLYRLSKKVVRTLHTRSAAHAFSDGAGSGVDLILTFTSRERAIVRVDYQIESRALSTLSSLGLTNPASLAWERVPYSFVVDWFLPIGHWFNTFDSTLGKTFLGGTETRVIDVVRPQWSYSPTVAGRSLYTMSALPSLKFKAMDRETLLGFPSSSPPAFKNPCSPVHVANAMSLLVTALTRGVPSGLTR